MVIPPFTVCPLLPRAGTPLRGSQGRCGRVAVLFTVLLLALPAALSAQESIECVSCTTYAVSVTPDAGNLNVAANTSGLTTSFTVTNTGSNNTSTYELSCGAPGGCAVSPTSVVLSAGNSTNVTATYSTGPAGVDTLYVFAEDVENDVSDYGKKQLTMTGAGLPVISASPHAASARITGACLAACFDAIYQRGGPGYVSLGTGRGLSLVYNSGTHRSMPIVTVDVTKNAQSTLPNYYKLQVSSGGSLLPLANGTTSVFYTVNSTGLTRLVAVIADTNALTTGAHAINVIVEARYTSPAMNLTDTIATRLLVNDRRKSVFGAGVGLAGYLRVHPLSLNSVLVTDGDGSTFYYDYCAGGCGSETYRTPGGTSARLSYNGTTLKYRLTALDSSYVEFNAQGRMTKAVDRFGNTTTLSYASGGADSLLRAITDPMGKIDSLCYGASCGTSGKLSEIRSLGGTAGSRTMTVLMDAAGRLIRFTDPDNLSDSLAYNSDSLLAGVYNRDDIRTDLSYDAIRRLDSVQAPSVTLHDGSSGRPTITLTSAERILWQPSASGTSEGTAKAGLWPDTLRASIADPLGAVSRFALDRFGGVTKAIDPFGAVTTFTRDTAGRVTQAVEPNGHSVTNTFTGYDLTRVQDAGGGVTRTVDYTYDPANHDLRTVSGDVVRQDFHYYTSDGSSGRKGALKSVYLGNTAAPGAYPTLTNALLMVTHKTDNLGRDTLVTDSLGHGVRTQYESTWGNVWKVFDASGVEVRFTYSSRGLRDTTVAPVTGKSYVTYGTMNQVLTEGRVLAGTSTGRLIATYTYHNDLSLWVVQTPRPKNGSPVQYTYSYNAAGWLAYKGDPGGSNQLDTYKYDLAGNLRAFVNRNGKQISMTYDKAGRLLTRSGPDFPTDYFRYDTLYGRWQVDSNAVAWDSVGLDVRGRLSGWKQKLNGRSYTGSYSFDAQDRPTSRLLQSTGPTVNSALAFVYANGTGRRDSVCVFAYGGTKGCVTFKRNGDGVADTLVYNRGTGNVWRLYQGYDANHRITTQDYAGASGLDAFDLTQSYDSLSRVRNRTSPKGGSFTRRMFRYDSLGFLRNACDSTASQCQNTVNGGTSGDAWTYDSTGNRSQVGTSDGYGNGNRITSFGTNSTITHDSVGAIVCRITGTCPGGAGSGVKYGWDALGRLRVVKDGYSGAVVDSFFYDPQGRRVKKKKATGGTEFYVYEGSQVILDVDSTGAVLREYAWFPGEIDRLLALRTPTDTFAAVLDPGNGSVRGLARFRTGGNVKEYAELPWGDTAADTGFTVRYRFAGREFDQEAGLYYMRARYYDPAMGRWISEDPIGVAGGLNLYQYAGNDPVGRRDPWGLLDPACNVIVEYFTYGTMTPSDVPGELPVIGVVSGRTETRVCTSPGMGGGGANVGFGGYAYHPGSSSESESGNDNDECNKAIRDAAVSLVLNAAGIAAARRATQLTRQLASLSKEIPLLSISRMSVSFIPVASPSGTERLVLGGAISALDNMGNGISSVQGGLATGGLFSNWGWGDTVNLASALIGFFPGGTLVSAGIDLVTNGANVVKACRN